MSAEVLMAFLESLQKDCVGKPLEALRILMPALENIVGMLWKLSKAFLKLPWLLLKAFMAVVESLHGCGLKAFMAVVESFHGS